MFGMSFPAFLTLLVLGFISAVLWHVIVKYRVLPGFDGFLGKWIAGWVGGWLGSPVFGHWGLHMGSSGALFLIPAILGALTGPFLVTAVFRAMAARAAEMPRRDVATPAGVSPQFDLRKAS